LLKDAKELISETQNGLTVMSGYLFLREYEYKDLITLIEAKRYKIPNDRFNAFLLLIEE
jgi:V/A-type H+-transporting ATPase subunit C